MGVIKIRPYQQDFVYTTRVARAMSHPARFTIVQYLRTNTVGTNRVFQSLTKLNKATISQHIKELQAVGLVYTDFLDQSGNCYVGKECERILQGLCDEILAKE